MAPKRVLVDRVTRHLRGGSSSPVVVETAAGTFVAKLRGAGHGAAALVAELLVGEIAESLGLPVPERVLLDLPAGVERDDHNDELADLLDRSAGLNVGIRWLDGAREPRPQDLTAVDDAFAVRTLWLDGLVVNPDRSDANPNIVFWNSQPWLIDHGAALVFQHRWQRVTEESPREPADFTRHAFRERARLLSSFDTTLAHDVDRDTLAAAAGSVPDELLLAVSPEPSAERARAAYVAFLWKRLRAPRPFVPLGEREPD